MHGTGIIDGADQLVLEGSDSVLKCPDACETLWLDESRERKSAIMVLARFSVVTPLQPPRSPAMRNLVHPAFVLVLGVTALVLHGCAQKANEEPLEHTVRKVPAETPVATPEAQPEKPAGAALNAKEEFEHTLNQKLEELDEKVRELKSRVENLKESAKAEWVEKLADLDAKRKAAEAKLEEVRKSTGEAWEHLRVGAHKAWEELERAAQETVKDF